MLIRRSLQAARRSCLDTKSLARQLSATSVARDENVSRAATPTRRSAAADFSAELRRALGKQKQTTSGGVGGGGERMPRGGSSRDAGGQSGRGGQRAGSQDRTRSNKPSVLRKRSESGAGSTRFSHRTIKEVPRKIAEDIRPSTDWSLNPQGGVPFARVPYAAPGMDIAGLNAKRDPKQHRPLKTANRALTLARCPGQVHLVQGPAHAPTPFARPGASDGERPSESSADELSVNPSNSLAAEARQTRVRLIKETVGGDYERWSAESALAGISKPNAVERDAAHAVAGNPDLQPAHKAYTVGTVQQILASLEPSARSKGAPRGR